MKRILSAGEGYALFPTNINYWMFRYFPAWRALLLLVFSFFMCLDAVMAKGTDPTSHDGRAVPIPHTDLFASFSPLAIPGIMHDTTVVADDLPQGVAIGDTLPEWFWETELKVVNHPEGLQSITLSDYRSKLLVLNFWSSGCTPCIRTMDLLDSLIDEFGGELHILGVHLYDGDHKAEPYARKKGWQIPISVGNADDARINRLFYSHRSWGQVWIRDGVLWAVPKWSSVSRELVGSVLRGDSVQIDTNEKYLYKKGGSK